MTFKLSPQQKALLERQKAISRKEKKQLLVDKVAVTTRIVEDLSNQVFKKTYQRLKHEIKAIIVENSVLCNNTHSRVTFRGKTYAPYELEPVVSMHPDNLLKLSLRPRMIAWLENCQHHFVSRDLVNAYLMACLNKTRYNADLEKLLPEFFHDFLYAWELEGSLNAGCRLSSSDIEHFLSENEQSLGHVHARLAYNLINQS